MRICKPPHRHRAPGLAVPLIAMMCLFFSGFLGSCALTEQRIEERILHAWRDDRAMPLVHLIDETLTIERAYAIQTRVVRTRLQDRRPTGFKAGLTSKAAQARFGAREPIAGVLLEDASFAPVALSLREARGLHIETEVAMRIGLAIRTPLQSVDQLKLHVDGIAAALELPTLDYEQPQQLTAIDIVATNVAAAHFATAEFVPPSRRDPNALHVRLSCDGEQLSEGRGPDAMGDQWHAALWLVNAVVERGWSIEPGQVLLTGALGSMVAARPGKCRADFADWGVLEVEVLS